MATDMNEAPAPLRRRRLWELPEAAHELLLGLSFTPETLRQHVAHALGRMQGGRCLLQGSAADILFSAIHDLGQRNALSEALHKRLDERHALAQQRFTKLHDEAALQAAWQAALDGTEMVAALWALLTHRLGARLQVDALFEARGWLLERARQGLAQSGHDSGLRAALDATRVQADALRQRLEQQQRDSSAALDALRLELAAAQGEARRWRERHDAQTTRHDATQAPATVSGPRRPSTPTPTPPAAPAVPQLHPVATAVAPAAPPQMQGRRILCVGGVQRAVGRYRAHIEHLGGRFEHHDGGAEDGVQQLQGCLQRADLVLCQAGCINHEAYRRIKRFCERSGKPCVYLPRPSLAHFERALAQLAFDDNPAHNPA